jgi:DNA/RNA endonuclease YhcR with UshA esterase domain
MKTFIWLAVAALLCAGVVQAETGTVAQAAATGETITCAEAAQHVGETRTVCGQVVGTKYLETSGKKPTFLNFEKPFPRNTFTVVIFGTNRSKFKEAPEIAFKDKTVCVTGTITMNREKPEIVVTEPSQITIKEEQAQPPDPAAGT